MTGTPVPSSSLTISSPDLPSSAMISARSELPCAATSTVPPRSTCAKCGVLLGEEVEVGQKGTITTFCIVNVPFLGQTIKIPYVAATILIDGAAMGMQHLIQECEASDVRMGMRVEPVWKPESEWQPSLANVAHFRPTGEPDAPFESFAGHL